MDTQENRRNENRYYRKIKGPSSENCAHILTTNPHYVVMIQKILERRPNAIPGAERALVLEQKHGGYSATGACEIVLLLWLDHAITKPAETVSIWLAFRRKRGDLKACEMDQVKGINFSAYSLLEDMDDLRSYAKASEKIADVLRVHFPSLDDEEIIEPAFHYRKVSA